MAAFTDTLLAALRTLRANKLRSTLTLLGIVIGVVAVVAMAATIEGLRRKISSDLAQLGSGVFQVQKQPAGGFGGGDRAKYEKRKDFTLRDVELLQTRCGSCLQVGGETWDVERDVVANGHAIQTMVMTVGATAAFFDNNGYALAAGRFFTEGEALGGVNVVVLGADVADLLFPGESAIGGTVRVHGHRFRVIATMARRGEQLGGSLDNLVVMPITAFMPIYGTRRSLNITIQARDPDRIGRTQDEVVALLRRARGVPPEADNDFEMFSNASMQETFENITGIIAAASIGICAIALLIGGIGVMNIMLVSVTERTSEIGVRRALGARRRRILAQFVVEAVMLTSIGGLLGVVLGASLAQLIHVLVEIPTYVPAWAVVLSMASAGGVGLIFGIYPAYRASRLDPVEAMRRE
ncbi:MAG: ABC transporter permease [Kofleriaceae bacterium]|nr:ABC transporter permease [Myxococcales bacterium]MCB9562481.1 ABC transporter permease [Kofleriaceae bacterium]MCB9570760.1 ABC transporter permease [Kofleriaceae bacterium]